jgi:CRISPR-associated protein Csm5
MPDYALYDVEILTYSPLHIGSGETLMRDYDYVVHNRRTWRLNLDALLAEKAEDLAVAARLSTIAPGTLLGPQDFDPASSLFLYVIGGAPRSSETGALVREHIRDAWNRPYLPGSSLKGALRTALLWHGMGASRRRLAVNDLNTNARWAAQKLEREILGRDPNHDLLRALQVADSEPLGNDALHLINAQVVRRSLALGSPIEVEAIKDNTRLRTRMKLDLALFSEWARQRDLDLGARKDWLDALPSIVQRFTHERLKQAIAWCGNRSETRSFVQAYRTLQKEQPDNVCYLQLGWGGGWDSKTLGPLLQQNGALMDELVQAYRLSRGPRRAPGSLFPATRRMAINLEQDRQGRRRETIGAPLGWVRLTFRRRS